MCWFSTTLLNTCDVKDVRYDKLMALNGRCSVKRQQICLQLGTIQPNMPPGPLEIKENSYLTDVPPSHCETLLAKTATLSIQHTCRVESCYVTADATYACWPRITVTNTAAVQTCLLVEYCCKMDACWTVATQSACLLTFCHSILHVCSGVCWRCVSLSAGMVSHYQPCLLV